MELVPYAVQSRSLVLMTFHLEKVRNSLRTHALKFNTLLSLFIQLFYNMTELSTAEVFVVFISHLNRRPGRCFELGQDNK
jgi:hypothetical protein